MAFSKLNKVVSVEVNDGDCTPATLFRARVKKEKKTKGDNFVCAESKDEGKNTDGCRGVD